MRTAPDGSEVVQDAASAARMAVPPFLILDSLHGYLDEHGLGAGTIGYRRIGDGQANVTYLISRGASSFVLRRGPRPPFPPSTHDMVREARIQALLAETSVRVPRIFAVCEDSAVLGVPFYVMEYLDGEVITDRIPPALDSRDQRRATGFAAVDALADLHSVDVTAAELSTIGRAEGYLERQLKRLSALWDQGRGRPMPVVEEIGSWLHERMPRAQRAAIVHGDFRLGNLMYHHDAPARVSAILDWEMATVGDPLADLGYFSATYDEPDGRTLAIQQTLVTGEPGYPQRTELVERYAARTGLDVSELPWYEVLALWKSAILCEALHTRWQEAQCPPDEFAQRLVDAVPQMLRDAQQHIDVR